MTKTEATLRLIEHVEADIERGSQHYTGQQKLDVGAAIKTLKAAAELDAFRDRYKLKPVGGDIDTIIAGDFFALFGYLPKNMSEVRKVIPKSFDNVRTPAQRDEVLWQAVAFRLWEIEELPPPWGQPSPHGQCVGAVPIADPPLVGPVGGATLRDPTPEKPAEITKWVGN